MDDVARNMDGTAIRLNLFDIRLLVALLAGPLNAYQLARQCEADTGSSTVSNGALYPALKRLRHRRLIQTSQMEGQNGATKGYKISSAGREVLSWELDSLNGSLQLGRERLRRTIKA